MALLAGAWAGGQRGVLLMQSSGVGNCINMLSLTQIFRFPFLTLVTMRGEWGEFNPWQVPMGSTTQAVFELSRHPGAARDPCRGSARGRRGRRGAGLQRLHADRRPAVAAPDRRKGFHQMSKANLLDRRAVVSSLLEGPQGHRGDRRPRRLHLRHRRRRRPRPQLLPLGRAWAARS